MFWSCERISGRRPNSRRRPADALGEAVGDPEQRQWPGAHARSPAEGVGVGVLLGGERQPRAELDPSPHRHAEAGSGAARRPAARGGSSAVPAHPGRRAEMGRTERPGAPWRPCRDARSCGQHGRRRSRPQPGADAECVRRTTECAGSAGAAIAGTPSAGRRASRCSSRQSARAAAESTGPWRRRIPQPRSRKLRMAAPARGRSVGSMSERTLSQAPAEVVIVGGGVAALETLIALRDLAGDRRADHPRGARARVRRTGRCRSPSRSVLGDGAPPPAARDRRGLRRASSCRRASSAVDAPGAPRASAAAARPSRYDQLVLAPGARILEAFEDAIAFGHPTGAGAAMCASSLERLERAARRGAWRSSRRRASAGACRCTSWR